jgi:hypothetical protein
MDKTTLMGLVLLVEASKSKYGFLPLGPAYLSVMGEVGIDEFYISVEAMRSAGYAEVSSEKMTPTARGREVAKIVERNLEGQE